jgi:hypothetical protein
MVIVNSASVIAQRRVLTFTATSTDPALVNPTVVGNNLTLTYGRGLRGSATVTVTATEEGTGATTQDTFEVTVGSAQNVSIGQGANAQSVVFTDADGTVATIRAAGGSVIAAVSGDNLAQSTTGRTVTVTGNNLGLSNLTLVGDNPNVTIKTVGGSDGRITVGAMSAAGPARGVSGRGVVLRGSATFSNSVGRLDLAGTDGATITIQRSGLAGFVEPSITIGTASNTDITSQAPLKVKLGTWGGDDVNPDTITAPAIRNLQVNGDFNGALDVSGNGQRTGTPAVGNVRVGGVASGAWTVGSLKTLRAGTVANAVIRSGGGIGSIVANSITGTTIFAGMAGTAAAGALPIDKSAFATPAAIGTVTLRGKTQSQFASSVIAATTLGRLNLGVVSAENSGTAFGVAADAISSLLATPGGGTPVRVARLTEPGQSIDQSDFEVRVL